MKNKSKIIHMICKKEFNNGYAKYLCNFAILPNFDKIAINWNGVTCKNCLKCKKNEGKNEN